MRFRPHTRRKGSPLRDILNFCFSASFTSPTLTFIMPSLFAIVTCVYPSVLKSTVMVLWFALAPSDHPRSPLCDFCSWAVNLLFPIYLSSIRVHVACFRLRGELSGIPSVLALVSHGCECLQLLRLFIFAFVVHLQSYSYSR